MMITRRYIECFAFVILWVASGWLLRLSTLVYQIIGLAGLTLFQAAVARRPLAQLWVREAEAFRIDRAGAVTAAMLMLVPLGGIVKHRDSWDRVLVFTLAMIGAVPAAFALRQQRTRELRAGLPASAAAVAIGCAVLVAIALHEGRSPALLSLA